MNAHKDTQHPAGQVINEEASQKTLSDYIRSIKRAEAFDAVARERKFTFDEWYRQNHDASPSQIWCAALRHGKV